MQRLTVSTDELPYHFESHCLDDSTLRGQWDIALARDLLLARFQGPVHAIAATAQQIAACQHPRYFLSFNLSATDFAFSQAGRDAVISADRALLFSGMDAFSCRGVRNWMGIGISVELVQRLVPSVKSLTASALDGTSPVLIHLKRYLGMLMEPGSAMDDPALTEHIETTICDLLNLALGATGDMASLARLRGLRAARCAEIIKEIGRGFADPAFSVLVVATRLGVSPSYVQQLLRETGLSFSERVLELRLQKARRMLSDRRNNHLKVSEIALACGFNEVSYFNRCFRRRYESAPRDYRGR